MEYRGGYYYANVCGLRHVIYNSTTACLWTLQVHFGHRGDLLLYDLVVLTIREVRRGSVATLCTKFPVRVYVGPTILL